LAELIDPTPAEVITDPATIEEALKDTVPAMSDEQIEAGVVGEEQPAA
jgi:hypothetical protein